MRIMEVATVPEPGYCADCDEPGLVISLRFKNWPHKIPLCKRCIDGLTKKFTPATNGNGGAKE